MIKRNCEYCGKEFKTVPSWDYVCCSNRCSRLNRYKHLGSPADRLLNRSKEMPNGCREWQGSVSSDGYGMVGMRFSEKYAKYGNTKVHRISYLEFVGEIPEGMHVLHKCDNRKCINPNHLFLGTNADNVRDRNNKNRQTRGEKHPHAKLTEVKVKKMRALYETGNYYKADLGRLFNITQQAAGDIILKKTWKHI